MELSAQTIALVTWFIIGGLITIYWVDKEREPFTAGFAVFYQFVVAFLVWLALTA